jgi:hypothetical protein
VGMVSEVNTSDFVAVRPAHITWSPVAAVAGAPHACQFMSYWTTVRLPLTAFGDIDRTALSRLRVTLDAEDHDGIAMRGLLDSVELVGHVLDPVCGDGFRQDPESCDGFELDDETCVSLGFQGGELACTNACTFDTSGCGDDEPDPDDCPIGEPGCPGGLCHDPPSGPGVAAYFQDGRYCDKDQYICRHDGNDWICHDCAAPEDSSLGCPCFEDIQCAPPTTCHFNEPELPGIALVPGACWEEGDIPSDWCIENCEATARICSSTVDAPVAAMCLIPDCFPYCEITQEGVCDRVSQCVEPCVFDQDCAEGQVCTDWGECWG